MPTVTVNVETNRTTSMKNLKTKRDKAIDFNVLALAKSGAYGIVEFIGTEKDTEKFCFKQTNGNIVVLGLWSLVQRPEATEAREYAPEFSVGVLKGLEIGTDVVIAIANFLWDHKGEKYVFAESKAKTISYRKTDGTFALRADSTDLILKKAPAEPTEPAPTTPKPRSRKNNG